MARSLTLKTAFMAFFTGLSRVSGLVRTSVLASFFGASLVGDAFLLAFKFPNLLRRLFGEGAMSAGFVPIFSELVEKSKASGDSSPKLYFIRIFSLLFFLLLILSILAIVFAPTIVNYFYLGQSGVSEDTKNLATLLFRLMFPYLLLISLAAIVQGVLNTYEEFTIPAITPIFLNLAMIAAAFLYLYLHHEDLDRLKAIYLSVGVLVGGLLQFTFQLPWLYRLGYELKLTFQFNDPELKRFFTLMLPAIFSAGIYQLNTLLIDPFAVALGQGSVSALFYSLRLQELPLGMVVVSIATVSLPSFSKYYASGEHTTLALEIEKSLSLTSLILFPIILFSFFFGKEMISLLYGYKQFGAEAIILTTSCFVFHIASLWFVGISRILTNVFFARQDTKTPLYLSILALFVNLFFAWLLTQVLHWGVAGLAMAGGLAAAVMALGYFLLLKKNGLQLLRHSFFYFHLRLLGCLILPALGLWLLKDLYHPTTTFFAFNHFLLTKFYLLSLIVLGTILLLGTFVFSLWLFRIDEGKIIFNLIKRKLSSKKDRLNQ